MKATPISSSSATRNGPVVVSHGDVPTDAPRTVSLGFIERMRHAVRTDRATPGAWASGVASLVREALVEHGALDEDAATAIVIEAVEPGTGRCLEIGSSSHISPPDNCLPQTSTSDWRGAGADRALIEIASSSAMVVLRAISQGAGTAVRINAAAEFELRLLLTVAAESLAEHVVKPDRRRQHMLRRLTETQQKIFYLMLEDLSEREIGERVGRSPHTIHDHVKAIYSTLGTSSRTELLALWYCGRTRSEDEPV